MPDERKVGTIEVARNSILQETVAHEDGTGDTKVTKYRVLSVGDGKIKLTQIEPKKNRMAEITADTQLVTATLPTTRRWSKVNIPMVTTYELVS